MTAFILLLLNKTPELTALLCKHCLTQNTVLLSAKEGGSKYLFISHTFKQTLMYFSVFKVLKITISLAPLKGVHGCGYCVTPVFFSSACAERTTLYNLVSF